MSWEKEKKKKISKIDGGFLFGHKRQTYKSQASLLTLAQGTVWYICLNICFQFLNNITRISIYFFTHTYFQKIQTTLLKQHYQTALSFLMDLN